MGNLSDIKHNHVFTQCIYDYLYKHSLITRLSLPDKKQTISGTITAPLYSANTGSITSPNFPLGYALNGEAFTYIIQNLDPYGHVRLVFDDWDLADESYIEVIYWLQ